MNNEHVVEEIIRANEDGRILGYRSSNIRILIRAFSRAARAKEDRDRGAGRRAAGEVAEVLPGRIQVPLTT